MIHIKRTDFWSTPLGLTYGVVIACLGVGLAFSPIYGQEMPTIENDKIQDAQARDPEGHWTPERLQNAEELTLPLSTTSFSEAQSLAPGQLETMQTMGEQPAVGGNAGGMAGEEIKPDDKDMLYAPMTPEQLVQNSVMSEGESGAAIHAQTAEGLGGDVTPEAAGTLRAHYSSSRLVPQSARIHYPYRTAGKLFFQVNDNGVWKDSWCSAAVIKPRLILTAGHCVHNGTSAGWHRRWLFVPAEQNGNAPYQAWNWRYAITTSQWAGGGGGVPNEADLAIIELEDRKFGSQIRRIGTVTGWLAYKLNVLRTNHTKKLGYPGNLDAGVIMHQVDSGSHRFVAPNNVEYGSDMRGGSSGGPWVQNFGIAAAGQSGAAINPEMNAVVSVTSYGYIATDPKVQGGSILNQNFTGILNSACTHRAGNC